MKKLSQQSFGAVEAILIVVIIAIVGFTGWRVYDANKSTQVAESSTSVTTVPIEDSKEVPKKPEPKIPEGMVEYKNKELGFKMAYPKEWGTIKKSSFADPKLLFGGTFSNKNNKITFGLGAKNYTYPKYLGDPPCVLDGFGSFSFLKVEKRFPNHYYDKELLKTSDRQVIENYKIGYCGGNELSGRVKLELPRSNGIDITYYKQKYTNNTTIPKYMKNKNNLISETFKQQFIDTVNSVKSL